MILTDIRQKILNATEKFNLAKDSHIRTWNNYFFQYNKAFLILLKDSLACKYSTNCKFMPFMFLFRHSMELWVKHVFQENNGKESDVLYTSHDVNAFTQEQADECKEVLNALLLLQKDIEGACWRYPMDRNGSLYFSKNEKIDSYDACVKYINFINSINIQQEYFNLEGIGSKHLHWELQFHSCDCTTMGQAATQYDFVLARIVDAIINDDVSINSIYLPILFFLRHTLELKLKQGIIDLGNIVNENVQKQIRTEHSVKKLYEIFASFIDIAIAKVSESELKKECEQFRVLTVKYKVIISELDAKSLTFRYPFDKKGNISNLKSQEDIMVRTLDLYIKTDTFLCFATEVLMRDGALEVGDDILGSLFN